MKILIACEESQVVTKAFRDKGHEAYSCDILPTSGDYPEWHRQGNVMPMLSEDWDMVIAFPPCTHLSSSGARWWPEKQRDGRQARAINFFKMFTYLSCPWAIENPIGLMSTEYRKPDQIIQPWQYGHGETKATCLWLNKLSPLEPTNIVEGRKPKMWLMPPGPDRAKLRSKTYEGIALAMAEQWGGIR